MAVDGSALLRGQGSRLVENFEGDVAFAQIMEEETGPQTFHVMGRTGAKENFGQSDTENADVGRMNVRVVIVSGHLDQTASGIVVTGDQIDRQREECLGMFEKSRPRLLEKPLQIKTG